MGDQKLTGRVTIPTDIDVVPETLDETLGSRCHS